MDEKITVFVDSSYIIKKFLDTKELETLLTRAKKAHCSMKFYTTQMVKYEVRKNILKDTNNSKNSQFLRLCFGDNNVEKFIDSKIEEYFCTLQFDFVEEAKELHISDYESIFNKYKNVEPPFSKDKREEFKDAYILLAIERFISIQKFDLVGFISDDPDWKSYLESKSKPNYRIGLEGIKNFLTEKENGIKIKEKLTAFELHYFKQFNDKHIKDLRIKLLENIWAYANLDNEAFTHRMVDKISRHYEGDLSWLDGDPYCDLLNPIMQRAVNGDVDVDNGFNVKILNCIVIKHPTLDLETITLDQLLPDEIALKGNLECSIKYLLSFDYAYDDLDTATFCEGDVFPHFRMGGTATLEGKAFVEFDCEGFEFSGENFEVEDVTNFEILEEGSLDFNPEDITERDEEELDIT